MVHLELLGSGAAWLESERYALPLDKRSGLLIFLALKARPVQRQELTRLFWADSPDFEARRNLRQLLQRVWQLPFGVALARQAPDSRSAVPLEFIGTCDWLEWRFKIKTRDLSVLEFSPSLDWNLPDAPDFMAWLEAERQDMLYGWRALALETADQDLMRGESAQAIGLLERVLAIDPLAEDTLQLLLAASQPRRFYVRGMSAFQTFATVLQRDVGVNPAPRTLELLAALEYQVVPQQPTMLPPEPRFFGREQEITDLGIILQQPETRLLTLTGFGGTGKTRLAKHICPDAILVRLENVFDELGLLTQIAQALGVRFAGHQDAKTQLLQICQKMPSTTLLLDNYEQLLPQIGLVNALVETGLRMVITSRQALGLNIEQIYVLQGLSQDSAIQLFLERSQRQNPNLKPDPIAIQRIIMALDGMPLALELAATWTRTLPLKALADELEQDTGLLDWRNVFEGSWRRLPALLRKKLCVLSVCVGGFDRETARQLAEVSLQDLAILVKASLLKAEDGRFTMLKLIRHAAEKNLEQPEKTKALHSHFFLNWLASLENKLEADPKTQLNRITLELENIRAAWNFACQTQQSQWLAMACPALSTYLDLRGLFYEAQQLFTAAATAQVPDEHAKLLMRSAWAEFRLGYYQKVQNTLQQAQQIYVQQDDLSGIAGCQYQLGNVFEGLGDFTKATIQFEAALKIFRQLGDTNATARVLNSLGLVSLNSGHAEKAVQYHRESLELRRPSAQPRAMFIAQLNLGDAQKNLGQLLAARQLFVACLDLAKDIGDQFGETLVRSQLADLDRREQRLPQALTGFTDTLERCRRMGHGYVEVIALRGMGLTLRDLGQLEAATTAMQQSLRVAMHLEAAPQTNLTLVALAELQAQGGQHRLAWQIAQLVLKRQPAPRERQLLEQLLETLEVSPTDQIQIDSLEEILPFSALA